MTSSEERAWEKVSDLEDQIADIKANCDLAIEGRDIKIKELEEENAELKKKNLDTQDAVTMQMYTNKANKEIADRQLTKAKEIIKDLMSFSVQLCDCRHTVDFEKTRGQAEQFLKGENIILEDAQNGNSPFDADEVFNKEMKAYSDEK